MTTPLLITNPPSPSPSSSSSVNNSSPTHPSPPTNVVLGSSSSSVSIGGGGGGGSNNGTPRSSMSFMGQVAISRVRMVQNVIKDLITEITFCDNKPNSEYKQFYDSIEDYLMNQNTCDVVYVELLNRCLQQEMLIVSSSSINSNNNNNNNNISLLANDTTTTSTNNNATSTSSTSITATTATTATTTNQQQQQQHASSSYYYSHVIIMSKCMELMKQFLKNYRPSVSVLIQIHSFCHQCIMMNNNNNNNNNNHKTASVSFEQQITLPVLLNKTLVFIKNYIERVMSSSSSISSISSSSVSSVSSSSSHNNHSSLTEWNMYIRDYSSSNNNNNNNNATTTTTSSASASDAVNDVLTTTMTAVPSSSSSAIANSGTNQYYSQFDSSSPQSLNHHLHNRFSMESSPSSPSPSSSSTTDQQNHLLYMTMLSMMMSNDLVQYKYQSSSSSTTTTTTTFDSSSSSQQQQQQQQQPSHHNNKNHLLENNVYMGAQFKTHSKFEDKSPEIDTTNMLQINHLSSLQKQIDTVIQYKKQKKDGNQQQQQQQLLSSPRQAQQQQQLHSPQSTPSKKKNHSKSSSTGFMSHNNNNNNHATMDGGGIDVAHVSTSAAAASGATTTTTAEASSAASSSSFYYRILSHLFLIPYNNSTVKMNHAQQQQQQHVTDQTSLNELLDMMLLTNDYYQSSTTTTSHNNNNNNDSHASSPHDGDSSNSSSHMIDYEIMIQSSIRLIKDHFSSLYTTTHSNNNNNNNGSSSSHSRQQLTSFFLEMIESPHAHIRVHSFDFLFNLLHYSIERVDDSGTIQSMISSLYKSQHQKNNNSNSSSSSNVNGSAAISTVMNHMNVMMIVVDMFQKYCDMVLFLLLNHERDALVWNSAYHCLFSFITIINHCVHQQQLYNNHQNHNYRSSSSSSRSRSSSTNNRYHSGSHHHHHHNHSNNNQTMMMLTMMIPMSMVQMLDVRVIHHFVQLYHMSNRDLHTHINHNNNNNNNNHHGHHHHHHMKYHMKVKYYNNCSNDSLSLLIQWMTNSIMSIHHLNHFYLQGKRMSNTVGDLPVIDPMNNASNSSSSSSSGGSSSSSTISNNNQSSTNTSISYHLDDTKLQMIGGISSIIDMYIQYHNIHVRNNLFVILYEYCWYQLWVNNNNNNNNSSQQQQQQSSSSNNNNSNSNNNDYHYSYYYHLLFELFAKVSAPYHMQQMFIYLPLDMIQSLSKSLFMCYLNEYHQNNNNNTSNNNNNNSNSNNSSNSPLTLNNNNYFYHNSSVRESIQQNIISFCIQMYQIAKSYCAMESECSQIANELISTGLAMNNNNSRSSGDDDEGDGSLSSNYHTCIHLLSSLLKSKDSMEQRSGQYLFFSVLKWVDEASANNNNNNSSAANMLHSPHKNNQYWMPPTTSSSQRLINQSNASYFEKLKQSLDTLMNDLSLSQDEHDQLAYLSALNRLIHFQKSKFQSHGDPDRLKLLFTMMNNSLLRLTSHTNMSAIVLLDMFSIIMSFVHMYPISLTNPSGSTTTAGNGKNKLQDSTRSHGPYDNMIHGGLCSNEDHYHHANNFMIGSECDDGTNHCMYNHNDDHDDDSLTTTNNKKRTNHAHRSVNECDMDMYSLFLSGKSCVSFRLLKEVSISILHFVFTSLSAIVSSPSSRTSSSIRGTDVEQVERVRIICILFIIEKCSRNRQVLDSIGIHFFKQLLEDCNGAVAFFAAKFLMKLLANKFPEEYLKFMKQLIPRAQKSGNAHLLHNPFLQLMVEE